MHCLDERQLKQFVAGSMLPADLVSASEHISACEACHLKIKEIAVTKAAALSIGQSVLSIADCPEYEELSAFVDGEVAEDAGKTISQHILSCELCKHDVDSLESFRSHASLIPELVVGQGHFTRQSSGSWLSWRRAAGLVAGAAVLAALIISQPIIHQKDSGSVNVAVKPPNTNIRTIPAPGKVENETPVVKNHTPSNDNNIAAKIKPGNVTPVPVPHPVVVAMRDGGVTVTQSGGRLTTNLDEKSLNALVEQKLRTGKLPSSFAMAKLDTMRGSEPTDLISVKKLTPVDGSIADARPVFTWEPVEGASKYRVEVYNMDGTAVLIPGETETPSYQFSNALPAGNYKWVVRVLKAELGQWNWSKSEVFKVLSRSETQLLDKAETQYSDSHLVRGSVYEYLGLNDKAFAEYRALVKENPNSPVARRMLAGVRLSH